MKQHIHTGDVPAPRLVRVLGADARFASNDEPEPSDCRYVNNCRAHGCLELCTRPMRRPPPVSQSEYDHLRDDQRRFPEWHR